MFFHELQLCFFRWLLNQEGPAPVCPFELWKPFSLVNVLSHSFQCLLFELLTKYIVSAPTSLSVPAVTAFTVERDRKKCPSHYSNQVCVTEMFVAFLVLSLFTLQLLTPVCHCTQTLHSIIRPANTHANQAGRVEATVPNSLCIYMCSCVWHCTFAGVHLG